MEGPSLHILSQELQILKNQKINKIFGNSKFDKQVLLNQQIKDVYSYGKRLIIQLNDYALIFHFLMYGSYRINSFRSEFEPRLAIITKTNSFFAYNCSVKCIQESNVKKHLSLELDILAPNWNIKKVIKLMQLYPNSTIDDVLLDQTVYPGVGNIIKNEALFLSKISPLNKIKHLTLKQLKEIALNARLFSQKFLVLHQNFELRKNLQIYRKSFCMDCGAKIIRKKTGQRDRWSFFCPNCQKIYK